MNAIRQIRTKHRGNLLNYSLSIFYTHTALLIKKLSLFNFLDIFNDAESIDSLVFVCQYYLDIFSFNIHFSILIISIFSSKSNTAYFIKIRFYIPEDRLIKWLFYGFENPV